MISALLYATTVLTGTLVWFATKFQLGLVPPEISLIYRFGVAAPLLMGIAALCGDPLRHGLRIHAKMALFGGLVFGGNFVLIYAAIGNLTSGLVATIFSTSVLMNIGIGAVLLGRKIERRVILGAFLGLCGLALIFNPEPTCLDLRDARTLGILQALGATMLFSLGNIISASLQAAKIPALVSMAYGTLLLIVFALLAGKPFLFDPSQGYVLSLAYLTIFGAVIGYGTYFSLLGRIGLERAAYTIVLVPALALGVSTLFEGFAWDAAALLGAALIFGGNIAILWQRKPSPYVTKAPAPND